MSVTAADPGRPLWRVLASPKMLAILALGAASGFPNQLTESALQAWLKDAHVTNTAIGLISYVGWGYLLKPFWAPLVDRYPVPLLGRRRGWMLVTQLALAVGLALMALQNPASSLVPVAACAALVVLASATQDISIDAYRADVALPSERGPASAAANLGYRAAAWTASSLALLVAQYYGWRPAYLLLAVLVLVFCLATYLAPEPAAGRPPRTLRDSVLLPLRELFASPSAQILIAVVVLFKVGDAFANKLFTPFLLDLGFSKPEVAFAKLLITVSAIGGAVIAGVVMIKLGLLRSMLIFGALQAVSNLLYCALAVAGKSYPIMMAAVIVEHVAGGMGGIALVALIMALCDVRFSAFQYALLAALASLPRYSLGYPAGLIADHAGWFAYFVVSFALGLPGLLMVWYSRAHIVALDTQHEAPA